MRTLTLPDLNAPDQQVHLQHITNPWDPIGSRVTTDAPWHPGVTIARLIPEDIQPLAAEFLMVRMNGERLEPNEWGVLVEPGDYILMVGKPGAPLAFLGPYLIMAVVSAAVGFLIQKLFPPPEPPRTTRNEESSTYGWSGIRTQYDSQGAPIPLLYGEHPTGGMVISQWVESTLLLDGSNKVIDTTSRLRLLLLLGQEFHSIGGYDSDQDGLTGADLPLGLKINDNSAENFDNVVASLRLGRVSQTVIPGFEATRTQYDVGLLIDNVHDPSGSATPTTAFEDAAVYDMVVEGDEVVIGVECPLGLYDLSGSTLSSADIIIEVKYQQLISGVPSGPEVTPSFFKDGDSNPRVISGKLQGQFVIPLPLELKNPATYAAAVPGDRMIANKATGFLETPVNLNGTNVGWPNNTQISAFSCSVHGTYTQGPLGSSPSGDARVVWAYLEDSQNAGTGSGGSYQTPTLLQGMAVKWTDSNPSSSADTVGLEIEMGQGSNQTQGSGWNRFLIPNLFSITNGQTQAFHLGISFRDVGGTMRLLVVFNGTVVFDQSTAIGNLGVTQMLSPGSTNGRPFRLGSAHRMEASASGTGYDEVRIYKRYVLSSEYAGMWNNGNPIKAPLVGSQAAQLVAHWSMNVADSTGLVGAGTLADPYRTGTFDDLSGNGLPLAIDSGIGSPGGVVVATGLVLDGIGTGAGLKGTYRISVQRRNVVRTDVDTKDECNFSYLQVVDDAGYVYPMSALLGLDIVADDQLDNSSPDVQQTCKGQLVPVWDGVNTTNPNAPRMWSATPAWCMAHLLTTEQGLGALGYDLNSVEWPAALEAAQYQDELVSDQRQSKGVLVINHGTWTGGSVLDTLYPDGFIEFVFDYGAALSAGALPTHFGVGLLLKLLGEDTASHAWAQTIMDGGPYEIVEAGLVTTFGGDTMRAPWPSALLAAPPSPTSWTPSPDLITGQGYEERMRCDLVLDRAGRAWDQVQKIGNAGRMATIKTGDKVRMRVQKPRVPVAVFSSANIEAGSFRVDARSPRGEFNTATMEILDREQNYRREPVEEQHPSLQDTTQSVFVQRQSFAAEGIVRQSHARRELRFMLNANHLLETTVSFRCGLDAAFVEAADVIMVTHDLPLWAFGGRCIDQLVTPNAPIQFIIDHQVVLASGVTYYAAIRRQLDDEVEVRQVASPAGTYEAGQALTVTSPFSATAAEADLWVVGQATTAAKLFQVTKTGLTQDLTRTIEATEYSEDVFDESDFANLPEPITELTVPAPNEQANAPVNVSVGDNGGIDPSTGAYVPKLSISWQFTGDGQARMRGTIIWGARYPADGTEPGAYTQLAYAHGRATQVAVINPDFQQGDRWAIKVQPVGKDGGRPGLRRLFAVHVRITGRSAGTDKPTSVDMVTLGDSGQWIVVQAAGARASGVEVRAGYWVLGQLLTALGQGELRTPPTDTWLSLPTPADARDALGLTSRNLFENGQTSDYTLPDASTDALASLFAALVEGVAQDEAGDWSEGVGALTNLEKITGTTDVQFTDPELSGDWTSDQYVVGTRARWCHVSFGYQARQIHPRQWDDGAGAGGGGSGGPSEWPDEIAGGSPGSGGMGDEVLGGSNFSWGGQRGRDWTWEGPTDDLGEGDDDLVSGAVQVTVEWRYGTGATPTGSYVPYRPGWYQLRSFQFRVTFTREATDYDIVLESAAYRVHARGGDLIDGGTL